MTRRTVAIAAVSAAVIVVLGALYVLAGLGGPNPLGAAAPNTDAHSSAAPTLVVPESLPPEATPTPQVITEPDPPTADPGRCAGLPVTDTQPVVSPAGVSGLVLCSPGEAYLPGRGYWSTWETRAVPTDLLPGVVDTLPYDPEPATMCIAIAYSVPVVVVNLADGTRFVADVPYGACDGGAEASVALGDVAAMIRPEVGVVAMTASEQQLATGCGEAKAVYPETSAPQVTPKPADAALSVCVYVTDPAENTTLQSAGPAPAEVVRRLLDTLAAAPPAGCTPPGTDGQVGSFVSLVVTPQRPAPGDLPPHPDGIPRFTVQTDGCRVVVDGGWSILGWADPALVEELTAATN